MNQKYDLLAISLLVFSAIIVSAITMDPKGFSLSQWQPLMAAVLALGGAGIIYRGATLAYRASMAKIDLDREVHQREARRHARGIFLRVRFCAFIMRDDARYFAKLSTTPNDEKAYAFIPSQLTFRTADNIEEAWSNLDAFPSRIAHLLARIRIDLYNFRNAINKLGSGRLEFSKNMVRSDDLDALLKSSTSIAEGCQEIYDALKQEIASLDR